MKEMKQYTIAEICSRLSSGKGIPASKVTPTGPYPVIGGNGVRGYTDSFNFDGECAIIGRQGANCGNVRYFQGKAYMTEHAIVAIGNENANTKYLACLFSLMHLGNLSAQSAQPGLSVQTLSKQIIYLPEISTQNQIADIIKSLDKKIELNNRINHNLEEQAQALYKSWFVDFEPFKDGKFVESELGMIPEGWRVGQLSEIAKITMGQSPSGTSFNEDGNGIVFYQGRTEFGFRFPSIRLFTTEPTRYAEPDSVLLSVRAPVGDVNIASQRCCIGRGLASIESISGNSSFILYTILSLRSTLDRYNGEGTVFGSVNRKELESLSVIIPPENIQNRFEQIASTLDEEIKSKSKELNQLSESRDSLLPRLMSGEITC